MSSKIKLIITADDYGMCKAVDDGIIEGIKAGVINSVSVCMNFKKYSKSALRRLINVLIQENLLKKVAIGLHLNFSSGEPLTPKGKILSLLTRDEKDLIFRFYTFEELRYRNKKKFDVDQLKIELTAQIQAFLKVTQSDKYNDYHIPIDHFTSQHNVSNTIPRFAKVLVDLALQFKDFGQHQSLPIPTRRPLPMFMEFKKTKDKSLKKTIKTLREDTIAYTVLNNIDIGAIAYKAKWMKKNKLKDIVTNIFAANKIACPHLLYFCFYGSPEDSENKVFDFQKSLNKIRREAVKEGIIKNDDTLFIEIIHHLGIKPTKKQRADARKISGFDFRYFRRFRPNELQIVQSTEYKDLLNVGGISLGHFSDLNKLNDP